MSWSAKTTSCGRLIRTRTSPNRVVCCRPSKLPLKVAMPVRRARSACSTRAAADWRSAWASGHVRRHHVLDVEEIDDRLRLLTALLFDPRQVADPQCFELPHELQAHVVTAVPLVEFAVGADAEDPRLNHLVGSLEAVDSGRWGGACVPARGGSAPQPPERAPGTRRARGGWSGRSHAGRGAAGRGRSR